jgi:hypothetical protein
MRLCVLRRGGDVDRVEEKRLAESEEARTYAHALLVLSQRNPDDVEGFIRAVNELCVTALRVDRCGVWGWQGESLVCFDVYDALAAAHEVVPTIHAAAHPAYTSLPPSIHLSIQGRLSTFTSYPAMMGRGAGS